MAIKTKAKHIYTPPRPETTVAHQARRGRIVAGLWDWIARSEQKTQRGLARALGMSDIAVSRILRGKPFRHCMACCLESFLEFQKGRQQ